LSLIERALKRVRAKTDADVRRTGDEGQLSRSLARAVESALTAMDDPAPEPRRSVSIDLDGLRAAGVLPPADKDQAFARQYRRIKRPLIAAAAGKADTPVPNANLIMVASALPGEGKTFTSVNLALSFARERDLEVLLVDADVAKPHITGVLGLREEPGLMDALADDAMDVAPLILPTDVPRLSVLPAGRGSEDSATELLGSARMQALVRRILRLRPNRIVLFDSPPVLVTSESEILAHLVGQIVLVVRAGVTPQAAVLDALDLLGDKPIGVVLNQVTREPAAGYYGYGYGYAYGGYGDAPDEGDADDGDRASPGARSDVAAR
jgi:exopolysaccharide/PEP-CTERM locus tyrosine autokinase